MDPQVVLDKVLRLVKGDFTVFDEVKNDTNQTIPAVVIAAVSILLFGFGGALWWAFKKPIEGETGKAFVNSFILGSIIAFALWLLWVFVTYGVLTSVLKFTSDWQALLRTMGYAMIPLALGFLILIPKIGFGIGIVAVGGMFLKT